MRFFIFYTAKVQLIDYTRLYYVMVSFCQVKEETKLRDFDRNKSAKTNVY